MDWKKWRSEGLGASDAPVVMGVSPWRTRYQLWQEKCGFFVKDDSNWATRRGNDMEPKARAHYELLNNIAMPVAFVQNERYPFIRASLDGYNESVKTVLEIKCPGKADHDKAKEGKIPDKYWPQVQHQLLASNAEKCHYFSFDGEKGILVEVLPDKEYQAKLLKELIAFWALIVAKKPPEPSDKDFKKIKDPDLLELAANWKELDFHIKDLELRREAIRDKLIANMEHSHSQCGDIKISHVFRSGSIDYSKVPQLKDVDLEPYRKEGTLYWQFKTAKL
jgi:putative phage-type endonuclease